jgi:hypothetical protein
VTSPDEHSSQEPSLPTNSEEPGLDEAPTGPQRAHGAPGDPWSKRGALAGLAGVLATLATIPVAIWIANADEEPPETQSAVTSTPELVPQSRGTRDDLGPTGTSACVGDDGLPTLCSAASAWLRVPSAQECSPAGAVVALGLDPEIEQVALESKVVDGSCAARPLNRSLTADALAAAKEGSIVAGLRICQAGPSSVEIACDEPHLVEWTSTWLPKTADAETACRTQGRKYTDRVLDGINQPLLAVFATTTVKEGTFVRCAIQSSEVLVGSVRSIGNGELPTPR